MRTFELICILIFVLIIILKNLDGSDQGGGTPRTM